MRVEIRLKGFLTEHQLDYHGVINDLAEATGVHRHTIARMYNNRAHTIGLQLLGEICDWIVAKNPAAREALPGGLIGLAELLPSIKSSDRVRIYQGEYHEAAPNHREYTWVAPDDAEVVSRIAGAISRGRGGPEINLEFVPFQALTKSRSEQTQRTRRAEDEEDFLARSEKTFDDMRAESSRCAILIGSQRVNLLVERFVADCFGCEPFEQDPKKLVPFYLRYRAGDLGGKSCFGGTKHPQGYRGEDVPGIYYLNADRQWIGLPWERGEASAGVVIARREAARASLEIALFGYSGRATLELGRAFVDRSSDFWPLSYSSEGCDMGVFIFRLSEGTKARPEVEVIPLDSDVLRDCLEGKWILLLSQVRSHTA